MRYRENRLFPWGAEENTSPPVACFRTPVRSCVTDKIFLCRVYEKSNSEMKKGSSRQLYLQESITIDTYNKLVVVVVCTVDM